METMNHAMNQGRPVTYDVIAKLMAPASWPAAPETVEAKRREAERLLGRPFPAAARGELHKHGMLNLTAATEWSMLDTLRRGAAPHVVKLGN